MFEAQVLFALIAARPSESMAVEPLDRSPRPRLVDLAREGRSARQDGSADAEALTDELISDFDDLDLDDLLALDIEVTSATRSSGVRLADAPAAIAVITADDIRRSGLYEIAEVLRLSPGLHVGRLDNRAWTVSARGFANRYNGKMLVLRDGRSLYTPDFAGVYWDFQDTIIEDLERVEVIRGPGGTLWGSNAVNGVINFTSKSARDTQGTLVDSVLSDGGSRTTVRHGGALGDDTYYRVFGKGHSFKRNRRPDGSAARDDGYSVTGGFRIDRNVDDETQWTLQGDTSLGRVGRINRQGDPAVPGVVLIDRDASWNGANLLGRWSRTLDSDRHVSVQSYIDWYRFTVTNVDITRYTYDVEAQYNFMVGDRHEVIVGGGIRLSSDDIDNTAAVRFLPENRTDVLVQTFVQDTVAITDALTAMIGLKLEHNDYTGLEVQPSARFVWRPDDRSSVWGAVSRAVRVPA